MFIKMSKNIAHLIFGHVSLFTHISVLSSSGYSKVFTFETVTALNPSTTVAVFSVPSVSDLHVMHIC